MHLYVILRGIKHATDRWKTELQGKYLPIGIKDKKTNIITQGMVQVAVRPIELLEIVFPEEHKDLMLNSVLNPDWNGKDSLLPSHIRKEIWALRKMLGAEPIPKYPTGPDVPFMPIAKEGVAVTGIGIKEDKIIDSESIKVEGL